MAAIERVAQAIGNELRAQAVASGSRRLLDALEDEAVEHGSRSFEYLNARWFEDLGGNFRLEHMAHSSSRGLEMYRSIRYMGADSSPLVNEVVELNGGPKLVASWESTRNAVTGSGLLGERPRFVTSHEINRLRDLLGDPEAESLRPQNYSTSIELTVDRDQYRRLHWDASETDGHSEAMRSVYRGLESLWDTNRSRGGYRGDIRDRTAGTPWTHSYDVSGAAKDRVERALDSAVERHGVDAMVWTDNSGPRLPSPRHFIEAMRESN